MNQSLFIGKTLVELDTADSTNNYAKQLLANSKPIEGTVITAITQWAGKGQGGNKWLTEAGKNLTISIVLYPDFLEADKQFFLNMAVALGIKDFCEFVLNDEVKIKWPNDIYYLDKKLGGVLIENVINGNKIGSSIIGIGINVNQNSFDDLLPNPVSFKKILNKEFELSELREKLCSFVEKYYLQLKQQHFNFLDKAYTVALYRYQQTHEFKKGEHFFRGEINGVTKEGKLIMHSNGKEHRYAFKEVEYVI
jgi:BirA family biotin operon repressor/biotin-[acetyl-CoA-carboxylase] ligase